MSEPCIMEAEIAKISANLENLKTNFEQFKTNDFHELKEAIKCITNKMNKTRPSWTVSWIITFLSSAVIGLLVLLFKI